MSTLTDDQKRAKIAESLGWTEIAWFTPPGQKGFLRGVPPKYPMLLQEVPAIAGGDVPHLSWGDSCFQSFVFSSF